MANRPDEPFWPFDPGAGPSGPEDGAGDGAADGAGDGTEVGAEKEHEDEAGRDADATQVHRSDDTTRQVRPTARITDETQVHGDGAGNRPQPPAEERERWSARAGVPAPGDPALRRPAPQEWPEEEEDPYHGRSWLMPVVIGVVALVLVAALSLGLYLIYRATAEGHNAPGGEESTPASTAVSPAASPAPPSSAPPPSAPPSSEAPASAPGGPVTIPPLRGDSLGEATVKLQVLGLNVKVERAQDDSLPPGEVLSTRPGEGATVLPGETITLVVAEAPSTAPSRAQPSASASR